MQRLGDCHQPLALEKLCIYFTDEYLIQFKTTFNVLGNFRSECSAMTPQLLGPPIIFLHVCLFVCRTVTVLDSWLWSLTAVSRIATMLKSFRIATKIYYWAAGNGGRACRNGSSWKINLKMHSSLTFACGWYVMYYRITSTLVLWPQVKVWGKKNKCNFRRSRDAKRETEAESERTDSSKWSWLEPGAVQIALWMSCACKIRSVLFLFGFISFLFFCLHWCAPFVYLLKLKHEKQILPR